MSKVNKLKNFNYKYKIYNKNVVDVKTKDDKSIYDMSRKDLILFILEIAQYESYHAERQLQKINETVTLLKKIEERIS